MSYAHPTADVNSAGQNPDPLTGARREAATTRAEGMLRRRDNPDPIADMLSWKRISEDVIHYRRFESLPQNEQDAIRIRRQLAFKNSDIPWIVSDYTALATALDDVDDLGKTGTLAKDYVATPASQFAKTFLGDRGILKHSPQTGWKAVCDAKLPKRARKQQLKNFSNYNWLSTLGLGALAVLFPSWRIAALLLQAAQTADNFFGIGLQLGPLIGAVAEKAFRVAKDVGGPLFEFENKYEQIKAARITGKSRKLLAAAPEAHPDDTLTLLTGVWRASDGDYLPTLIIKPDDYPSMSDIITGASPAEKELFDFARLALSLPYNLGATLANSLLKAVLGNYSRAAGGPGDPALPKDIPDNEQRALLKLLENGICPAGQCSSELFTDAAYLASERDRYAPQTGLPPRLTDVARDLFLSTDNPVEIT